MPAWQGLRHQSAHLKTTQPPEHEIEMPADTTLTLLKQFYLNEINVDVMAGFEARMKSKRAQAPEHLNGVRWSAWHEGRDAAKRYLDTRRTFFIGETPEGKKVEVIRKGWVARGKVVTQMERKGVTGDVFVTYIDASSGNKPRMVKCCI